MNQFFTRSTRFLGAMLSLLTGIVLSGCGNDNGTTNGNNATTSQVRSFNAYIPSAGNSGTLNISSGGTSLTGATGLGYGQTTTGYTTVNSGAFQPTATGTGVSNTLQASAGTLLTGNNSSYTLVTAGQEGQAGTFSPQLYVLPNYNSSVQQPIGTGQAAIRVVNLSPGLATTSLYTTDANEQSTLVNSGLGNVNYGYSSALNSYVNVPLTSLNNLSFQSAANPGQNLTLNGNSLNTQQFQSGRAYTIYIYGQSGNATQPLNTFISQDA